MEMTQEQQIRHYRKMIQELSEENERLKAQLEQYDETRFAELVNETMKMKDMYESEMKKAEWYREEWVKTMMHLEKMNRKNSIRRRIIDQI